MSDKEKLRVAYEALRWAYEAFKARDVMEAKVHCAPVQATPITERIKQALDLINGLGEEAGK